VLSKFWALSVAGFGGNTKLTPREHIFPGTYSSKLDPYPALFA
jgi:hypothetical protein